MNLDKIPSNENVVIDANILVYAVQQCSAQCRRLLGRCADDDIMGIIPVHILAEAMHVFMLAEARDNGWISGRNPAQQLAAKPERVRTLIRYENVIRDILALGAELEPVQREDFISALSVQRQAGLLTNDALMVAVAQRLRITAIATADQDLRDIPGMIVYMPDDIQL